MIESYFSTEITINVIIQSLAFVIGLFINIKVVSVCWRNRETKTWKIHIAYSVLITIFFAFDLPFVTISNAIPNLSMYTGEWFCSFSFFVVNYGVNVVISNSLILACMKYIYIVHWDKAMVFGHEKIQTVFFILTFAIPFFIAGVATITNDFDSYKAVKNCFGIQNQPKERKNGGVWQRLFLCNIANTGAENYVGYVLLQIVCVSRSILSYILCTNLPEAFFYYKVFKKMRRWVSFV